MIICNNFSDLNSELILEIIPVITSLKIKKRKENWVSAININLLHNEFRLLWCFIDYINSELILCLSLSG
jgi:hypothetical protein